MNSKVVKFENFHWVDKFVSGIFLRNDLNELQFGEHILDLVSFNSNIIQNIEITIHYEVKYKIKNNV